MCACVSVCVDGGGGGLTASWSILTMCSARLVKPPSSRGRQRQRRCKTDPFRMECAAVGKTRTPIARFSKGARRKRTPGKSWAPRRLQVETPSWLLGCLHGDLRWRRIKKKDSINNLIIKPEEVEVLREALRSVLHVGSHFGTSSRVG